MLRALERKLKHLLSHFLRFILHSSQISLSPDTVFDRILVIRQHNQLGDMLCIVPLMRTLREKYPDAFIALMASPVNYDVMRNNRFVNHVIKYDKGEILGKGLTGWKNLIGFVRMLRASQFEVAIVPSTVSTSFTSDLFAFLCGAQARIGAASLNGKENPSSFFFNIPVELDWSAETHRHQTLRNVDIARPLGLSATDLESEITFDLSEANGVNRLKQKKLDGKTLFVFYHPGAGKLRNRWNACNFAAVANELSRKHQVKTHITCGPMDEEPVREMVKQLDAPHEAIKGKSIREVAVLLSTADLVITNDTGVMHVAAAVGVPVLSLFGPTDPEQWAPVAVNCRYLKGRNGDINTIQVDEVIRNAQEMLHIS